MTINTATLFEYYAHREESPWWEDEAIYVLTKKVKMLQRSGLLRFARALKDNVVILRKCPWGAMTTYKGINYSMNFWDMTLEASNKRVLLPPLVVFKFLAIPVPCVNM